MRSTNIDSKVELRKTINVSNDVVTVTYRITPTDDAERVQLVERLPQPVPASAISCDTDSGRWEVCDERKLLFVGSFSGTEPIRTTLRIESPALEPADCVSTVTLVPEREGTDPLSTDRRTDGGGNGSRMTASGGPAAASADAVPALGLVGTTDNVSAVARTTVRAMDHGLSVFIAADPDNQTLSRIGGRLGATVVEVDLPAWGEDEIATRLSRTAQQRSHPGIIFHGDCQDPIAFEESVDRFAGRQDAVSRAVVKQDRTGRSGIRTRFDG